MSVIIRRAHPGDLPSVGRLGAALMRVHFEFDPQRFLRAGDDAALGYASFLGGMLHSDESAIFVAAVDETIVGYVWAALEPLSWKELRGPAGFIHDILVVESARRQGIATQLLDAAVGWLRERKAPRVVLWTAAANEAGQKLFAQRGFRDTMIEMTMEL